MVILARMREREKSCSFPIFEHSLVAMNGLDNLLHAYITEPKAKQYRSTSETRKQAQFDFSSSAKFQFQLRCFHFVRARKTTS